jgi:hypothetical protein
MLSLLWSTTTKSPDNSVGFMMSSWTFIKDIRSGFPFFVIQSRRKAIFMSTELSGIKQPHTMYKKGVRWMESVFCGAPDAVIPRPHDPVEACGRNPIAVLR